VLAITIVPAIIDSVNDNPHPSLEEGNTVTSAKLYNVYKLGKDERNKRGMKGRLFAMSKEAMMTAENMAGNVISAVDETFDKFVPRKRFDLSLVEPPKAKYIEHKLTGY
jgi:hypothetical protein